MKNAFSHTVFVLLLQQRKRQSTATTGTNFEKKKWGIFMLTTDLIHPEIMGAIALCGHGDKILISDGNYPLSSQSGDAKKNLSGAGKGLSYCYAGIESAAKCFTF